MDSKTITIIIVFSALAVVLNPVMIPTVFWPGQYFRLWEIPIITAFLLFGFKVGFSVAVLNCAVQMAFFPGPAGIIAGPWGVVLMLTMFLGVYLAKKLAARRVFEDKSFLGFKPAAYFTGVVTVTRAAIMPFVDYVVYRYLLVISIGRSFPEAYIVSLVPFIVLFNVIVPLYTVPICYLLAKTVNKSLRVGSVLP